MPEMKKNKPDTISEREVVYPDLEVCGVKIPEKNTWITEEALDAMLGWEDEDQLRQRVADSDEAKAVLSKLKGADRDKALDRLVADEADREPHTLTDEFGKKVWLRNNVSNREYNDALSRSYTQDMLNGEWQFNGESWIIGRTGADLSLQHRGTGAKRAFQLVEKQHAHWESKWPNGFKLRGIVVCGIEETDKVIATLDNVRTRNLTDTMYTQLKNHRLFAKLEGQDYRVACKMMDACIDLFWKRTHATETDGDRKYQTHASSLAMLDRHPKLYSAVKHLYEGNLAETGDDERPGRSIGQLKLSPGQAAAMLYLMGASGTDGDAYRNARPVPNEKKCDLSNWDKAEEFWSLLAGRDEAMAPLVDALVGLTDLPTDSEGKEGLGGRGVERLGLVAKAWKLFVVGEPLTAEDMRLAYAVDGSGEVKLVEFPTVDGIDLGDHKDDAKPAEADGEQDEARVEETKAEVRAKKAGEAVAAVAAAKKPKGGPAMQAASANGKPSPSLTDQVADVFKKAGGQTVIFQGAVSCTIFGAQAERSKDALGLKVTKGTEGLSRIDFNPSALKGVIDKLQKAGHDVAVRSSDGTVRTEGKAAKPLNAKPEGLPAKVLKQPLNKRIGAIPSVAK